MLKGQSALVTGGSRGIGKAIAVELAKQGVNVAVNYSGNREKAEEVANSCRKYNVEAFTWKADISKEEEVKTMLKEVTSAFGGLDILVNNAGITRDNLMMRMKEDDWDDVMNINLKGVFFCSKAAARTMSKQRSGKIINIASVVGLTGNPGQANYTAAKAGVIGLTKTMAKEFASRNIQVNAVAPGFIATDMTEQMSEEARDAVLSQIPASHLGKPDDVAHAVTFLASSSAGYITGQTINVDGGMVM